MKVLATFQVPFTISLSEEQRLIALTELNRHFFNDEECNVEVNGKLVAKYPEIEADNPSIRQAYCNISSSYKKVTTVELLDDGTLKIKV